MTSALHVDTNHMQECTPALRDSAEHIANRTNLERWTPGLTIDFNREDRIDVRLVQEMSLDRQMLRAVRAERRGLPIAPWGNVDQKIDARLGREVFCVHGFPRRNRRGPDEPPYLGCSPRLGHPPWIGRGRKGIRCEPADRPAVGGR